MTFRKEISLTASHTGQTSPKFYGFAWHDHYRDHTVYYPMPFNLIMRWLVMLYKKIKFPHSAAFDEFVHGIYNAGFKDGYTDGYCFGGIDHSFNISTHAPQNSVRLKEMKF